MEVTIGLLRVCINNISGAGFGELEIDSETKLRQLFSNRQKMEKRTQPTETKNMSWLSALEADSV